MILLFRRANVKRSIVGIDPEVVSEVHDIAPDGNVPASIGGYTIPNPRGPMVRVFIGEGGENDAYLWGCAAAVQRAIDQQENLTECPCYGALDLAPEYCPLRMDQPEWGPSILQSFPMMSTLQTNMNPLKASATGPSQQRPSPSYQQDGNRTLDLDTEEEKEARRMMEDAISRGWPDNEDDEIPF